MIHVSAAAAARARELRPAAGEPWRGLAQGKGAHARLSGSTALFARSPTNYVCVSNAYKELGGDVAVLQWVRDRVAAVSDVNGLAEAARDTAVEREIRKKMPEYRYLLSVHIRRESENLA